MIDDIVFIGQKTLSLRFSPTNNLSFLHGVHAGKMVVGEVTMKLTVTERGTNEFLEMTNPTNTTFNKNTILPGGGEKCKSNPPQ